MLRSASCGVLLRPCLTPFHGGSSFGFLIGSSFFVRGALLATEVLRSACCGVLFCPWRTPCHVGSSLSVLRGAFLSVAHARCHGGSALACCGVLFCPWRTRCHGGSALSVLRGAFLSVAHALPRRFCARVLRGAFLSVAHALLRRFCSQCAAGCFFVRGARVATEILRSACCGVLFCPWRTLCRLGCSFGFLMGCSVSFCTYVTPTLFVQFPDRVFCILLYLRYSYVVRSAS